MLRKPRLSEDALGEKLIRPWRIQWGTEHLFTKHYGNLPQFSAISGYIGGHAESPCKCMPFLRPCLRLATDDVIAYRQVCTGATGHAEAVKVTYQAGSVAYAELVEFFYRTHDPTTVDRQGPDTGTRTYDRYLYVLCADIICRVSKRYLLHNTGARGDC